MDLLSSAYIAYQLYYNQESLDFQKFKVNPDLEIIYVMNSVCTLYIYFVFLYFGLFKKSIKTYTLKEINYLEKLQNDSRSATLIPILRESSMLKINQNLVERLTERKTFYN